MKTYALGKHFPILHPRPEGQKRTQSSAAGRFTHVCIELQKAALLQPSGHGSPANLDLILGQSVHHVVHRHGGTGASSSRQSGD